MKTTDYRSFYKRNLPHYQPEKGIFFVTYRLHFSLPNYILEKLGKDDCSEEIETYLDMCKNSPDWLKNDEISNEIIKSWCFYNGIKYQLYCLTIMSNHVHVILEPLQHEKGFYSLSEILKGTKNFTAAIANKILNRKGQFWMHESYDHYIRDENELRYYIEYTLFNPVKAGLIEDYRKWKHYWISEDLRKIGY